MRSGTWRGKLKSAGSLGEFFDIGALCFLSYAHDTLALNDRSIFQDVPLCSTEEFTQQAPEDMHSEAVMNNEHQLMLNRLSFELSERQRYGIDIGCFRFRC